MKPDDFTYKVQNVDYLGFLEAQLRDLQGIDTLAYELIQNADDVKDDNGRSQTTRISFDVTDDALLVSNDGLFREVDFARLQNIAGGGKRTEVGTTGAFGIGFVAVYQITDAPEIFSNDRHWIIRPDAPPQQRIQERPWQTRGTRFRFPWAFDESSTVRRALRLDAIRPQQLDNLAAVLAQAVETAVLFLRQLQVLEVRRNGAVLRRLERIRTGADRLVVQDETGRQQLWLLFHGDFAAAAAPLRAQHPWQIEADRRSDVHLALPATTPIRRSRLFAVLPTDSTTPLPFHVSADFFPTTDRKRIHFDGGYQAAWNEAALQEAAYILAQNFAALPAVLGAERLWQLLQQIDQTRQMVEQGDLPPIFAAFWHELEPLLAQEPIVKTVQGTWCLPQQARIFAGRGRETAVGLLHALQLPFVDPALSPYFGLMRRPEINTPPLRVQDLVDALVAHGLDRTLPLYHAPPFLRTTDALQDLWNLIDNLLQDETDPPAREAAQVALGRCPLVLTDMMNLVRLDEAYRARPEARLLFPDVAWVHDLVPERAFPGYLVSDFGVRQAVDRLSAVPVAQTEESWRMGRLDIPGLFRWLEARQIEIFADDPALQQEILRLPLCPVAGELRPLAELYIPGNFDDPLQLTGMVDLEAVGGRRQFLRDLGVPQLDFDPYVREQIPRVLAQHPDLPADGRHRLVQLLAERLGEIRDDELLQEELSRLPLIACMDGSFRAAAEVYASRDVMPLLGDRVHVAEPVTSQTVAALHRWLGVREEPVAADLVAALLAIAEEWGAEPEPLSEPVYARVRRCWTALHEMQAATPELAPLAQQPVLPNRRRALRRPDLLLLVDRPQLASRFTDLDGYLLDQDGVPAAVAAVAGVRPLSHAVQQQRVGAKEPVRDEAMEEQIQERRAQIARVLAAESLPADRAEIFGRLRVLQAERHPFRYRLQFAGQTWTTPPESVPARLVPQSATLYVAYEEGKVPWTAVSRELAAALLPERPAAALALGLKEVLTAETAVDAGRILDELGYP